jgi:CHASE2 domain-containing sensor protein
MFMKPSNKNFRFCVFILLCANLSPFVLPTPLRADSKETPKSPFVAVFVDDATEKALGPFPYDRAKYAQVISVLRKAKAKAVVIKYFLDQAKPGAGDDALASELNKLPVLLQARLDPSETKPNPLSVNFGCALRVQGDTKYLLSDQSGWIPIDKFSRHCAGIGFVDLASKHDVLNIPMVLKYQDKIMPSLDLIALEMAFDKPASIVLGGTLSLAGHKLPVDASSQIHAHLPDQDQISTISFIDVTNGKFDKNKVAGKIVIMGFDAKETPVLPTPNGPIRIHRLFVMCLESLYQQIVTH